MSSIANRHVSCIDLLGKDPIFLKKHLLSNQNEVCNDCSFPKNIGTKMILFFVVFVVGFGIYFGIYFGIDMLIIVLLNFLDKHVFFSSHLFWWFYSCNYQDITFLYICKIAQLLKYCGLFSLQIEFYFYLKKTKRGKLFMD